MKDTRTAAGHIEVPKASDTVLASFIWKNAEDLWGDFKHTDFGKIILPFTLLRRLECVLEPTRDVVRETHAKFKDKGLDTDLILRQKAGLPFYNTSQYSLATLGATKTKSNLEAYVAAGFHKIHLDCSMSCADDPVPLPDATVAARSAELAVIAERTAAAHDLPPPVYVIGTEVPVPGGEASLDAGLAVTTPAAAAQTLEIHRQAFDTPQLREAWQRVIAMVVQPGVDFDHSSVHDYDAAATGELADFLEKQPRIVFEAHSTDYQRESGLHALVRDHFAILKVGPAATFAYREALFALAAIEAELLPAAQRSRLPQVLEEVMLAQPKYWQAHYHGDEATLRLLRAFAFSDRCRYYWGEPALLDAVRTLFANLEQHAPPLVLLSQYLPEQFRAVREGTLANTPGALVRHRIGQCLDEYARACSANTAGMRKHSESSAHPNLANG